MPSVAIRFESVDSVSIFILAIAVLVIAIRGLHIYVKHRRNGKDDHA